ncbi:MAG TPA: hypothetical protein VGK90_10680 [Rhizomicrobium sp.]|jgi:hypothetical protein
MQTEPLGGRLFQVTYGNKFDLNKMTLLPRAAGGVNFVSRSSENRGVSATVKPVEGATPYPAGIITVALGGTKLLSSFVQERPFYTAQNVAVLNPKVPLSFAQKVYVCVAIRHNRFRYSAFGREANRTIKKLEIPTLEEFPSWLESAVANATAPLAAQLAPLKTNAGKPPPKRPANVGAKMVPLNKLFDVVYGSNLELNALTLDDNGINFVSRTAKNNGVSAKVKLIKGLSPIEGPALSVAGGGSVLETFLQSEPFYSGRDLYVVRPKCEMTTDELFFIAAVFARTNIVTVMAGRPIGPLKTLRFPTGGQFRNGPTAVLTAL